MPRFYKYLNISDMETLNYLMDNANKFDKEHFNTSLRTVNIDWKKLSSNKSTFMDIERKLWLKLSESEKLENGNRQFENVMSLIRRLMNASI